MNEEDMMFFENVIDDPDSPDYMKFKAEILLLFDRYDPHNPKTTITPEQFIGTVMLEIMNMNFMFNSVLFDGKIRRPPFIKIPEKDDQYMEEFYDKS